jgi:Tfp pilus assembly protein PilE
MPIKSARVSAECAIANIMRFMEHYYNNGHCHSDMKVKLVMLKMF